LEQIENFFTSIGRTENLMLSNPRNQQQFTTIDETHFLEKQSSVLDILQKELTIFNHSSLFELIHFRYMHHGVVRSKKESMQLNDLLLEELQLKARQFKSFQSKKLHLHFNVASLFLDKRFFGSIKNLPTDPTDTQWIHAKLGLYA
jgi:hypothetical protein